MLVASAGSVRAQSIEDLRGMSIGDLADIDVSSVTKTRQSLSDAAAAIYVITHDDIVRSGARTVPEMLRLAPNLQVAQTSASKYVITARGMSGNADAQNFPNKLLVLIDGRSVYTPLYSGVYWDMQDVMPADVDRIEVISGPGASLWGATAVNGVINIITKRTADTQGGLLEVHGGTREQSASARYGGTKGAIGYRLYFNSYTAAQTRTPAGTRAQDDWARFQGGFRVDWTVAASDRVTLQGDAFSGTESQLDAPDETNAGRNLMLRWNHDAANGAALQIQTYYDRHERRTLQSGGDFSVDTYDLDLQHSMAVGSRNQLVWGGGIRFNQFDINGANGLEFDPRKKTLKLGNVFAQDTFALTSALNVTLGAKLEHSDYTGLALMPSGRVSWRIAKGAMLWGAVSRAVRAATPFDHDVQETLGTTLFVTGSKDFRTEKLTAYELGARFQPTGNASVSISGYYHHYDDLRSIDVSPVTGFLPLSWGNGMVGHIYGLEAWADYGIASWWRLSAGLNLLRESFRFAPGAAELVPQQQGDDPRHQYFLRSSMTLGRGLTIDADFRAIGARPDPRVPAYAELGGRIAWLVARRIELSLSAQNLLHKTHVEYAPPSNAIPRRVLAGAQWRF
jgi:iron complex outermembrane receptor protein